MRQGQCYLKAHEIAVGWILSIGLVGLKGASEVKKCHYEDWQPIRVEGDGRVCCRETSLSIYMTSSLIMKLKDRSTNGKPHITSCDGLYSTRAYLG